MNPLYDDKKFIYFSFVNFEETNMIIYESIWVLMQASKPESGKGSSKCFIALCAWVGGWMGGGADGVRWRESFGHSNVEWAFILLLIWRVQIFMKDSRIELGQTLADWTGIQNLYQFCRDQNSRRKLEMWEMQQHKLPI